MTNRIFIDAPSGVIELEGEKEFVEAQFRRLMPFIEASGFGTGANVGDQAVGSAGTRDTAIEASTGNPPNDRKRTKRVVNRPAKGHSCADRIKTLMEDGFLKEPRTTLQIATELGRKGWIHTSSQVSASCGDMFNRGQIRRSKEGRGFKYFWDRE